MSDCNTCFYNLAGKSSDNRPGTLCSNQDVPKTRGIPDCPHYKKRYFYRLRDLEAENDKLRELCADLLMCLTWQNEPHGYMEDGCDHCRFRGKMSGVCGLGMFRIRAHDFGIEVDG